MFRIIHAGAGVMSPRAPDTLIFQFVKINS